MGKIKDAESNIFDIWRKRYPAIVTDGVVNEAEYENIVFVLKEVNGGEDWDLCDFLSRGGRPATWNNIARWTYGILNIDKEIPWPELASVDLDKRKQLLKKICAMNVKKVSGKAVANSEEVNTFAHENKDLLHRQMEIYKPRIIICCGIGSDLFVALLKEADWKMTDRGIWYLDDSETILVDYFHPQTRVKHYFLYYGLIDAIKEILAKRE
ncbi:hypothetical protein RFF05_15965 [Bengtsoniella intestinalis]|uniref:hypothetical protein n=1 Tax=Bengtsoniella intestinalis TaxID=3073143 RepID=UPI00391FBCD5